MVKGAAIITRCRRSFQAAIENIQTQLKVALTWTSGTSFYEEQYKDPLLVSGPGASKIH